MASLLAASCSGGGWTHKDTYTDAFRMSEQSRPQISYDGDSVYTIKDWYGVPGYDVQFVLKEIQDSTTIDIIGDHRYNNGFYYVDTGLEDLPVAGISPGVFEPNNTILSGFNGDKDKGLVWSYVYLYDRNEKWVGGHYYFLWWGEAPADPVWTVEGFCTLPGDPAGRKGVLKAYADGHYTIPDWYGVEKYNLDFAVRPDGGIQMLDWYAEENGGVFVQARRSDLGDPLVPQSDFAPNGGLELGETGTDGAPVHGRLHFEALMYDVDDNPMETSEFVFEW